MWKYFRKLFANLIRIRILMKIKRSFRLQDDAKNGNFTNFLKVVHPELVGTHCTQCLKITEKVSFNIAREASYVYILSGQKLFKNAKNGPFGEFLKT